MKPTSKFPSLNIYVSYDGFLTAILSTLTTLCSLLTAKLLFDHDMVVFTWAMMLGCLTPLYRVGKTKLEQISYTIEHLFYTFLIINLSAITFVITGRYAVYFLAIFVFICYILPRYRKGTSFVGTYLTAYLVIVWSYYSQGIFDIVNLTTYLKNQSVGVAIANLFFLIYISIFPITAIVPEEKVNNTYVYIRAFRVAIAITVATLVAYYFHLYNSAWICFSVLVVMKQSLGTSIKKASSRLLGTILGILIGLFIVEFTNFSIWQISATSLCFLFLGCLFIEKNYALGLFFFTLLLADVFFFIKPGNITAIDYMMNRLVDTCIGILIAIVCELVIFPKTFLSSYRIASAKIYENLASHIQLLLQNSNPMELKHSIDIINESLNILHFYTDEVKYEPLVLLSKRYNLAKKIPMLLANISTLLTNFNNTNPLDLHLDITKEFYMHLVTIFNLLKGCKSRSDDENLLMIKHHYNQFQSQSLQIASEKPKSDVYLMFFVMKDLLNLYIRIYSTKKWKVRWK